MSTQLQERRGELEQAVLARVHAVADPTTAADPEYAQSLRTAVLAAIDYGLAGVERGEEGLIPVPEILLSQARLAAHNKINLDTVLRRYCAGYTLLGEFLAQEAEDGHLPNGLPLKRLLRVQAMLFDRLIAAVTDEYMREAKARLGSVEQRRAERVERLLEGQFLDTHDLRYEFNVSHVGLIAAGLGAPQAMRDLARSLDCRLLLIRRSEGTVWAWLGAQDGLEHARLEHHLSKIWPEQIALALGETAPGLAGWRFTHQQARAALPIALRSANAPVRYMDVALLASMLRDDLLSVSLRDFYLAPLSRERDGGMVVRQTLRAYFAAERNVSSAAAALGVSRQTAINRLRVAEKRLDRPLGSCAAELEAALRLEDLGDPLPPRTSLS